MPNEMDYSLLQRTPDGTGMFLVTTPGTPDKGSYETEQDLKNWIIAAVGGAIIPKGDILSTNLPAASASNKGWQYYCTDINKWATSDGTQWIMTSNNVITQTPDATDTGHALSNAVVTQCCNEVKGKLNQHESRIENLEQKAGDYGTWHYPNDPNHSSDMPNKVPTGKAKNGLVEKIVGKSRAWNQLAPELNSTCWEFSNSNGSFSDNVLTFTASAQGGQVKPTGIYRPDFINGHSYLFVCEVKLTTATTSVYMINGYNYAYTIATTNWQTLALKADWGTTTGKWPYPLIGDERASGWDAIQVRNVIVRDLTLIFPEGVPSTVAECVQKCPDLLKYNAYDAGSLVDTVVSGVRSVGVNIWDEEWELGTLGWTTGAPQDSTTFFRSKNYIPAKPNTRYYTTFGIVVYAYDKDYNMLLQVNTGENAQTFLYDTPSGTAYLRFRSYYASTVYGNNIQIADNSLPDAIKTVYHPYKTDTITLPETVTLRGVGTCVETLDLETGVLDDGKFGLVDMGNLNWYKTSVFYTTLTEMADYAEGLCTVAPVSPQTSTPPVGIDYFETRGGGDMYFRFVAGSKYENMSNTEFKTAMSGVYLLYEKATYTPSDPIDPIPDNTLYTEGGGTIDTIQDQTPVIDNCLDVGYLAV